MDPWTALVTYVAAPAKGKTIYEENTSKSSVAPVAITGGILAVGAIALFLILKK